MQTINGKPKINLNCWEDVNQCPTCGEVFNSGKAFDRHRRGDFQVKRYCLTPEQMVEKKMSKNRYGRWITQVFDSRVNDRLNLKK